MERKLYNNLKSLGLIQKIKCPSGKHFFSCNCGNKMLRTWISKNGPVGLCYDCGNLFYLFDNTIITEFDGSPDNWGTEAIAQVHSINEYRKPYSDSVLEHRREEFIGFFAEIVRERESVPEDISDEDLFESFFSCSQCDAPFYTENELNHALLEYDSPERTMDIMNEIYTSHMLCEVENIEYENVVDSNEVWRSDEFPNLIISPETRSYIFKRVSRIFCEWVIDGVVYDVVHDRDPHWDCSGELEPVFINEAERLLMYGTLGEWMDDCLNGDTEPTFESGHGLYHRTYGNFVSDLITDKLHDIFYNDIDENKFEQLIENDDYLVALHDIERQLVNYIRSVPSLQAWHLSKDVVKKNIEFAQRQLAEAVEKRDENLRLVNKFWGEHFKDVNYKIDKSNYVNFINRFDIAIQKCDKNIIEAIKDVSLPCGLSKKVKEIVSKKVDEYLKKV